MGKSKTQWVAAKTRAAEKVMQQYMDRIPANFRLGTLCSYGHEFEDSGFSLRYMRNANCVECSRITIRRHRLLKSLERLTDGKHDYLTKKYKSQTDPDLIICEIEKIRLEKGVRREARETKFWGPPCPNGHADPKTGKCLRYNNSSKRECVECARDKQERRRAQKREYARARAAALKNPDLLQQIQEQDRLKFKPKVQDFDRIRSEYSAAQRELKRIEVMERRMAR